MAQSGDNPLTSFFDPASGTFGLPWCVYTEHVRGIVWMPCGGVTGDAELYSKQEMLHWDHWPASQTYAVQGGFAGHGMDLAVPHVSPAPGREKQTGESWLFEPVVAAVLNSKVFVFESKEHPGGMLLYLSVGPL